MTTQRLQSALTKTAEILAVALRIVRAVRDALRRGGNNG